MRPNDPSKPIGTSKPLVLLIVLTSLAASGCASLRGRSEPAAATPADSERIAARDLGRSSHSPVGNLALPTKSNPVQTASFSDGVVTVAAGEAYSQQLGQDELGAQGGQLSDRESHSDDDTQVPRSMTGSIEPIDLNSTSNSGNEQSVDYFVSIALSQHPKIQAARQRVAAATNVIPQARALPDPMFNNTFWPFQDQALQTAGGRVGHQFGVSQAVPWPEKLRTKAAIANREVQMAQAEVDRTEREITEAVRLAYYEVWFAKRAISIIGETRELVDDLTQVAESRYRSGGSQQDVLRAQLEVDRLDDQVVTLKKQQEVAQADLATLVQQPVSLIPDTTEELGLTDVHAQLDSLISRAEQCSPELRGIASEIQRDRERQRLACLQKYPDLQFGLNYAIIDDTNNVVSRVANGNDNISFTLGTTLPIWRDKINAGIREAAHRTGSSTARLSAERDMLYGKLRRLLAQADALTERRNIYKDRIIPRTEDTLNLAIADYRGKRTDFFSLIETYRELLMFETEVARIDASLAGIMAQIERTVGCP